MQTMVMQAFRITLMFMGPIAVTHPTQAIGTAIGTTVVIATTTVIITMIVMVVTTETRVQKIGRAQAALFC